MVESPEQYNVFEPLMAHFDESTQQRKLDLARQFHRVFTTMEGQAVLQYLRSRTIEQPTFPVNVTDGIIAAEHGFFREGQNDVIRTIESFLRAAERG